MDVVLVESHAFFQKDEDFITQDELRGELCAMHSFCDYFPLTSFYRMQLQGLLFKEEGMCVQGEGSAI